MGRKYEAITESVADFIKSQPMFFVGTAPERNGHVNVSPKGADTLRVVDPNDVAYLDLAGSAAETIAHLRDNGRITFMWCSFGPKPRILRVYGDGVHVLPTDPQFAELAALFPAYKATRSIIKVAVERIADSCGFGVPEMEFVGQRTRMAEWAERQSPAELQQYMRSNNTSSIDGLPAWEG